MNDFLIENRFKGVVLIFGEGGKIAGKTKEAA